MSPRTIQPARDERSSSATQRARIRQISATLFAAKGYNGVGIAEIGDAVGLARGALYYHIGSKEDLLYDIASEYMIYLVEDGRKISREYVDPVERIRRLSSHLITTIAANRDELTVCFREINALTGERHLIVSRLHADYQDIWAKATEDGANSGVFRPISIVALKGLLGMYFYSFLWLNPNGKSSPNEIAEIFSDIVLRAVAPGPLDLPESEPGSPRKPPVEQKISDVPVTPAKAKKTAKATKSGKTAATKRVRRKTP